MINLEELSLKYFQNGFAVPYKVKKGEPLLIKPILVKDYSLYEMSKGILDIDKNSMDDIEIIQMSYLRFMDYLIKSDKRYSNMMMTIFELCFGEKNIYFSLDNEKTVIVITDNDKNIKTIINQKEFDEIAKIILNQNDPNYDNRYISPEVKELMEEYNSIKYKDVNSPTFEERKAFVCSKMGKMFSEINNMTCREFELIYNSSVNSEIYIGQKIIQGSYKYEVKEDIMHPLFQKKVDPYASIFEDTNVLSGKGINGAEQLNMINNNN